MNTKVLLQKSLDLFDCKQFLLAKEHLQAVLDLDPNNVEALFLMAQCDEALGKTKAMASSLFKILSIDSGNNLALKKLRNFGFLESEKGQNSTDLIETILDDGSVYLLPMHEDIIKDGFGAVIHDGIFYAGMFKDGKPFGHGMMKGSTGIIYVGYFNGGSLEGEGTMITDDYQVKTTFFDSKPNGKTPIEIKWKNGIRVIACIDESDWENTSNWINIEYYNADGEYLPLNIENGDTLDFETGTVFIWKDHGDFRDLHWGDSMKKVLLEEKENENDITIDTNFISYPALLAGFGCLVCFHFEHNCLSSGGYMFPYEYNDSQQFAIGYNRIASFFTKKYGNPTKGINSLVWHINFETIMTMPKWKSGVRTINAIYSHTTL